MSVKKSGLGKGLGKGLDSLIPDKVGSAGNVNKVSSAGNAGNEKTAEEAKKEDFMVNINMVEPNR